MDDDSIIDLSAYMETLLHFYAPCDFPRGALLLTTKQIADKMMELYPMRLPLMSVHKALEDSGYKMTLIKSPVDFSFYWMLKEK